MVCLNKHSITLTKTTDYVRLNLESVTKYLYHLPATTEKGIRYHEAYQSQQTRCHSE